jgi:hypothetical protein
MSSNIIPGFFKGDVAVDLMTTIADGYIDLLQLSSESSALDDAELKANYKAIMEYKAQCLANTIKQFYDSALGAITDLNIKYER